MFDARFAGIAKGFSKRFGGPFVDATAQWPGSPGYDAGGSIVSPAQPIEYPCSAQIDTATQAMRQAEGFQETDVRVLVLSDGLPVQLNTQATIVTSDGSYALLTCQRDAVGVGYECRGRRLS